MFYVYQNNDGYYLYSVDNGTPIWVQDENYAAWSYSEDSFQTFIFNGDIVGKTGDHPQRPPLP